MTERAAGQIHDLGYKRYGGVLRARSTLWRVIARHQIAMAMKRFWRFKLALLFAVSATVVFALLLTQSEAVFRRVPPEVRIQDNLLVWSFDVFARLAFLASMTVGAMVIASDTQSGAFGFYFARPVRPVDYVVGKVAGMFVLMACLTIVGPLILISVRIGLYADTDQILSQLHLVPKIIGAGALTALGYAVIPLAFSAMVTSRRYALALWVAHYLVVGSIAEIIGRTTAAPVAALDLFVCVKSMMYEVMTIDMWRGRRFDLDFATAAASIAIQSAAAIGLIFLRVRSAREGGVVGSS